MFNKLITLSRIKWVEQGKVPDVLEVDVSNSIGFKRTRTLCPYPHRAKYKGNGSAYAASSFECAT
jgi:feruloyl esterase